MLAHADLLRRLEQALMLAPAVASGHVGRHRSRPVGADVPQAVNLRLGRSVPDPMAGVGAPINYETQLVIECLGRAKGPAETDEAAGQVLQDTHTRIAANAADLAQAGYSILLAPTLQWDQDDADDRIGVVIAIYPVLHRTSSETLS